MQVPWDLRLPFGGKMKKRKPKIEVFFKSKEERDIVKNSAVGARVTISDYCRDMILSGKVIMPFNSEELTLQRKLAGMANNLNQIARVMNSRKEISSSDDVIKLMRQIEALLK